MSDVLLNRATRNAWKSLALAASICQAFKWTTDYCGLHLFKLLALESRDLSQAEKKIIVTKAEQIHKMSYGWK